MEWTWEDSRDVPNAVRLKREENETLATEIGSFMDHQDDLGNDTNSIRNLDMDDMNCLCTSDLNTFDFTLEDLQSLMEESLDEPLNEKNAEKTTPPQTEIERIIQYLLSDAPITEHERKSYQNRPDLPAEEGPKKNLRSYSAFQRPPAEERLRYPNMSFPLERHFEDLTCHSSREVNDGHRRRRGERDSKERFLRTETHSRETARKRGIFNDSKSNFCKSDIRLSHRARDRTNELDGDGYPFRAGERETADKYLEHRKFTDKWQESRVPQGKPLDFVRRMEIRSEWLSSKEEPRDEERGKTSKAARQKPQSKRNDRSKPKTTKSSSSKKAVR
ncbi:uncharacterized protein LOC129352394 [Poeciliopsis prolifica]|uniref:uncharacterized protein LOC129352394 n=1 Tax=Poeciliopsis prolifica TaxID=188132 RepID=UPI0024141910|nr:uncharacterized protein LOC129352394 [Poeciliopsis prolifica]